MTCPEIVTTASGIALECLVDHDREPKARDHIYSHPGMRPTLRYEPLDEDEALAALDGLDLPDVVIDALNRDEVVLCREVLER